MKKIPLWGPLCKKGAILILIAFLIDQASKNIVIAILSETPRHKITLAPFFDIVMGWNKGVSYGLFQMETLQGRMILILFAIAAITFFWSWLARTPPQHIKRALGLALIIGGALGNLCDRILYGAVSDFLSFHAFGFYWYVFNIADLEITIGVVLILWDEIFSARKDAAEDVAQKGINS